MRVRMLVNSVPNYWNGYKSKPIKACGSDSVIYINGCSEAEIDRKCLDYMNKMNKSLNKGFVGYVLNCKD